MHNPNGDGERATTIPPKIAVIVPVYKQGHYLKDSVLSAVNQSIADTVKVIIVNDGCPRESTDRMGRYFSETFKGTVCYLRKSNGGLASARNYGIRFALDAWPSIEALLPLDADDALSPKTLERLWGKLSASPPDVGWVYQDATLFGAEQGEWETSVPFSLYRLVHENYCSASSLFRRSVFQSGCWYDEQMRMGYEDWEFVIHASLKGFRGVHVAHTGFLYRRYPYSMVSRARTIHHELREYMRNKHKDALHANRLTELEHCEMPRFALITPACDSVEYFTNPYVKPAAEPPLGEFLRDAAARIGGPACRERYVPPILVFARRHVLDIFRRLRMLPGLLLQFQNGLSQFDHVTASLELAAEPDLITIEHDCPPQRTDLVCLEVSRFLQLGLQGHEHVRRMLAHDSSVLRCHVPVTIGASLLDEADRSLIGGASADDGATLVDCIIAMADQCSEIIKSNDIKPIPQDGRAFVMDPTAYSAWQHIRSKETTLPYYSVPCAQHTSKSLNVFFLLPLCSIGGVERCVLSLAKHLTASNPAYRLHLLITDASSIQIRAEEVSYFETISLLPAGIEQTDRARMLLNMLSPADVVVNANSLLGYQSSERLRRWGGSKVMAYLHAVDMDHHNLPQGFPLIACREHEPVLDRFCVISDNLKRLCVNLGVPEDKIALLPNAPVVAPGSKESGLSIVNGKCRRAYSADTPVKVLFIGRFDRQKGVDRTVAVAARLEELGVPTQLLLVGKHLLGSDETPRPGSNLKVLPATTDKQILGQYYEDADVFLLPSRWEGVPLTILEAMAFGNIVVATDVGAVREIVEHGNTGFLVDPTQSEDLLIEEVCSIILDTVQNPRKYDQLRMNAFSRAMDSSWAKSAGILSGVIDSLIAADGGGV
jgi:glycosyltransferase involved in cell wall biosynthesis